jgi:hypothetical protein
MTAQACFASSAITYSNWYIPMESFVVRAEIFSRDCPELVTLDADDCAPGRHSAVAVDLRGDHGWALLADLFEHAAAPASDHGHGLGLGLDYGHGLAVCYAAALHYPVLADGRRVKVGDGRN